MSSDSSFVFQFVSTREREGGGGGGGVLAERRHSAKETHPAGFPVLMTVRDEIGCRQPFSRHSHGLIAALSTFCRLKERKCFLVRVLLPFYTAP